MQLHYFSSSLPKAGGAHVGDQHFTLAARGGRCSLPTVTVSRVRLSLLLALVTTTALLVATPASAQSLAQCANGPTGTVDCTGDAWVTGSLNANKSHYREGDFVPFRVTIPGLRAGSVYTLGIGYDAVVTALHAYDYLGSYNASQRAGQSIVPCSGVADVLGPHACGQSASTLDVPTDTHTIFPGGHRQEHGVFSAWGATLESASYVTPSRIDQTTTGTVERVIEVKFRAEGPTVVIAWGGHVASILDWGTGRTFAGSGSGAPFHMRLKTSSSFNPGAQDVSLHAGVIAPRPTPFTTTVDASSIELGGTVTDTALMGGGSTRPTGSVGFFVCFAPNGPPDCSFNGDPVGHQEVLVASGTQGLAAIEFRPEEVGFYCFRAEYAPSDTALFSPAAHTNRTTECFQVTAPPTRLTVTKLCVPQSDTGRFNLLIDGAVHLPDARCGEGIGPIDVSPGTHTVSETPGTGTSLTDYETAFGGGCAADGSITLTLGQSATCTITNVRPGIPTAELTVIKECVPADDTGRFDVQIGSVLLPDLACGQSTGAIEVAVGSHQVTEAAGTNTNLGHYTTVTGGACGADGSVTLSAGESATCTITNRLRPARLTITKLCVPATDGGRFNLTINGQAVGRAVRCGATRARDLRAGTYHVSERGAHGTELMNYERVIGGDCDANGVVQIAPAESATCTITNVRRPEEPKVAELTLLKVCAPTTDGGRFNLRIDGVTAHDVSCGGRVGPVALLPGTHHVGEAAVFDSELSAYTTTIGGECHADGSISLTAGTSATCTITNVRHGTPTAVLTVVKHCRPSQDSGRFVLDVDEQEIHGIRCGQSTGPITVAAGTRLVGEVATSRAIGDRYKTAFGGDCSASGTVTLTANQHATCSVTNTRIRHQPPPPPPNACYTVTASPLTLAVGQRGSVVARVAVRGRPVPDVLVRLSGVGVSRSARTHAGGAARFDVVPSAPGRIAVTTPRQFGCPPAKVSHITVHRVGAPSFTG